MAKKKKKSPPKKETSAKTPPVVNEPAIETPEPPPPWIKSWNGWYALVLGNLLLLIILFYVFTKAFE